MSEQQMQTRFDAAMTAEKFAQWLERQPLDRTFESCNGGHCPIASYLAETFRQRHVGVGHKTAHVNLVVFALPQWAQEFILRFDDVCPCSGVTVATVLRLIAPAEITSRTKPFSVKQLASMSSAGHAEVA